jgi:hypothetical protein
MTVDPPDFSQIPTCESPSARKEFIRLEAKTNAYFRTETYRFAVGPGQYSV